jgi:hypothetical protein
MPKQKRLIVYAYSFQIRHKYAVSYEYLAQLAKNSPGVSHKGQHYFVDDKHAIRLSLRRYLKGQYQR